MTIKLYFKAMVKLIFVDIKTLFYISIKSYFEDPKVMEVRLI